MQTSIPKVNGFSRGINVLQFVSYIVILSKMFFFSFILIPTFPLYVKIFTSIIYYSAMITLIIIGYKATIDDPTDEIVKQEKLCLALGQPFDSDRYDFQCDHCSTSVSSNSKHCRTCNRCVEHFDHHCKWINNCVGKSNYKLFILLIATLAFACFWFALNGALYIVDYYSERLNLIHGLSLIKDDPSQTWRIMIINIYVALVGMFFMLDMKLLWFHIFLMRKNMTTYEYILDMRAKANNLSSPRVGSNKGRNAKGKNQIVPLESTPQSPMVEKDQENKTKFDFEAQSDVTKSEIQTRSPIRTRVTRLEKLEDLKNSQQAAQTQAQEEHLLSLKSMASLVTKHVVSRSVTLREPETHDARSDKFEDNGDEKPYTGTPASSNEKRQLEILGTPRKNKSKRNSVGPSLAREITNHSGLISAENTAVSFFPGAESPNMKDPVLPTEEGGFLSPIANKKGEIMGNQALMKSKAELKKVSKRSSQ